MFSFVKESSTESLDYSIPLIYYYGYQAKLTDENGNTGPIPVTKDEIGLVRVNDNGLKSGTIRIAYEKTTIQKISELISLLTLVGITVTPLANKGKQAKKNNVQ